MRKLLTHFDPELGRPLSEKDYGGNCLIYDPDVPENPYHNVWVSYICKLSILKYKTYNFYTFLVKEYITKRVCSIYLTE